MVEGKEAFVLGSTSVAPLQLWELQLWKMCGSRNLSPKVYSSSLWMTPGVDNSTQWQPFLAFGNISKVGKSWILSSNPTKFLFALAVACLGFNTFHKVIQDNVSIFCGCYNKSWTSRLQTVESYSVGVLKIRDPGTHLWVADWSLWVFQGTIVFDFHFLGAVSS